ncbi:hypothetical protein HN014_17570 [Aquimarina sp. TRL1]|uniref:hypothetical protein n=1 Tax=Aquimarina sp. (strain TRL1) TaxID=2736252 RepID=UPI00158CBFC5|nr:hypothetical protein [Aquimarina sp. TRL1]QKX06646.1 hypothetical protein HN014_17570 [Aquimarina sp. TRL1]
MNTINVNLGCVVYTLTNHGIEARWVSKKNDSTEQGLGIGKRLTPVNESKKFEGTFEIIYHSTDGNTYTTSNDCVYRWIL